MDSSLPKVTVVIPAYKAEQTIGRAIDSVLAQEGCDVSIIVVINPELDRTPEIVRGYGDSRIRLVINEENKGAQYSRNRGLSLVQDELVLFLCADDFVEGPHLASLAGKMLREGADLGLGAMQTLMEQAGRRGPVTLLDASNVEELFTTWFTARAFVAPCSVMWRTEFVRNLGGWDPEVVLQDDGLLIMKGILAGAKVITSHEGRGVYVIHDSPTKLTRRSDSLESLLKVPSKLLDYRNPSVAHDKVRSAAAVSYYNAAKTCFTRGRDDLGREALRRSRQLGFKGHSGPNAHRLLSSLIGLRLRSKLEYAVRVALGKPGG